ncbi:MULTISPECIES: ABC transporter permease [unclassified Streptomyces]|uniref:ABC transporter permease n=1 Tax=unclassified Streptomyces TaxID=2593676 RepID=UPI000B2CF773|nr:ABC transporter permease [Streptomyces sp. CNQ-509]
MTDGHLGLAQAPPGGSGPAADGPAVPGPAPANGTAEGTAMPNGAAGGTGADGAEGAAGSNGKGSARRAASVPLAPRVPLLPALAAVYRAQLSRARVARLPLLFVATFQSIGIMVLMRGVVDAEARSSEAHAVVAGSTVLIVAFVALNLLAQYFGQLRATGGLDHYATLPVPPAAVVLGAAGAYASFTVPGTVVTAVTGSLLFELPLTHLWILVAVVPLSGAALAGLGAVLGLLAPRPELATLCGQLGMSAALLLGVLPAERMPGPVSFARDLLPSTYGVEALMETFAPRPEWAAVLADLGVCAGVGVPALAAATWAYRRAALRS